MVSDGNRRDILPQDAFDGFNPRCIFSLSTVIVGLSANSNAVSLHWHADIPYACFGTSLGCGERRRLWCLWAQTPVSRTCVHRRNERVSTDLSHIQ